MNELWFTNVNYVARRMCMPRKFTIVVLIVLFGLAVAALYLAVGPVDLSVDQATYLRASETVQKKKVTTIRNVIDKTVHYTIKPYSSADGPMEKILKVGAIDRFPGDVSMKITFYRDGNMISYLLDPGMPYSFRYNENDELELYDGSHGRVDAPDLAPYVPTPMIVVERMLELAKLDKHDVLFDLGCGDGRIVITAARKYGARGVGIDIDPQRIKESNANAKMAGVEELVEFQLKDATKADFSKATVVTLYLLEESNALLRPILEKQLKPGTYVISHNYSIAGWEKKEIDFVSIKTVDGDEHDIYLYRK